MILGFNLSGATRLHVIVGDPIAQVRSPGGMTAAYAASGVDALVVPVQVSVADLRGFLNAADKIKNLDGILVTVPHKFSCFEHCTSTTARAQVLGAVNLMRRRTDGFWHGDMIDGEGFVQAAKNNGFVPKGKRALLIGAGGAGSAIALELVDQGVTELAIHDADTKRRDALIARLKGRKGCKVTAGSDDPTEFDFIANASPSGMKAGDLLPVQTDKLCANMFVGCVITKPKVTPLIAAARVIGCGTSTGDEMYEASQAAMVDFLLFRAE